MQDAERTPQPDTAEPTVENAGRRRFARQALLGLAAAGAAFVAAPQKAEAGSSSDSWKMEGNSNVDSTDFIGTTNAQPLVIKTNAAQRMTVHPNGDVAVGDANAYSRLYVKASLANGVALRGDTAGTQAYAAGVLGTLNGINVSGLDIPSAVRGIVVSPSNVNGVGVSGQHNGNGVAVHGRNASTDTNKPAILGVNTAPATVWGTGVMGKTASKGVGVFGDAKVGKGVQGVGKYGVVGTSPDHIGVYAVSTTAAANGRGLFAYVPPGAAGYAGEFVGNVKIAGNLYMTGNVYKLAAALTTMDHPLDPENRTLSMAGVESPELKNAYDGVATLDARGRAVVTLPPYVTALNTDFRYQLTAIGRPMPHLYIAQEVTNGSFEIAGGKPGARVSWQVTGLRADAYAQANPLVVEAEKPAAERGAYLSPEAFGLSAASAADANALLAELGPTLTATGADPDLAPLSAPTLEMPVAPLD